MMAHASEKRSLLELEADATAPPSRPATQRSRFAIFGLALIGIASLGAIRYLGNEEPRLGGGAVAESACRQFPPLHPPPDHSLDETRDYVFGPYLNTSVRILSQLVQIKAESFDDNGAVPVNPETLDQWTYPPFSGHFDGTSLWGRGSVDCRDTLAASMEAIELLIAKGFSPRRTFILSFGFDEESKGTDGAGMLSKLIEEIYGRDGVAFIVDEGGLGVGEMWGRGLAGVATAEKGYLDVIVSLHTPGSGHSSIPPDHTSIGILASIITSLEASPYAPSLSSDSAVLSMLQCAAEHGTVSATLKKNIKAASRPGKKGERGRQDLADAYAQTGKAERYLVATSQAVDVVAGGIKETASFVVNYRIATDSTPQYVKDQVVQHLLPIAEKHNLDLEAFGQTYTSSVTSGAGGLLTAVGNSELSPAPVTPTTGSNHWEVLSSTIQHIFSDRYPEGLVVAPCIMGGNGDTAFYWNVTRNIFRFSPSDPVSDELIHTVDEHLLFSDHIRAVWFYHEL
ncbi:hypothetical protein RQP46_002355 [Phenoliferia psychrophenolica]